MKKSFQDFLREDRRLTILIALESSDQYTANHFLLHRWCEQMGHSVSVDVLSNDLLWLQEQGLVALQVSDAVTVAKITQRGIDVAMARAEVSGVARPAP